MAQMTGKHLRTIRRLLDGNKAPRIFVESGTWHGHTTKLAQPQFRHLHTVELNPALHKAAQKMLRKTKCHCGNSADIIPKLAEQIDAPVFWYLDAHFFKHRTEKIAGEDIPLPLWAELEAIAKRPHRDIIVVDDVHLFGSETGPQPDWKDVTLENIAAYFPGHRKAAIMRDQGVVWK